MKKIAFIILALAILILSSSVCAVKTIDLTKTDMAGMTINIVPEPVDGIIEYWVEVVVMGKAKDANGVEERTHTLRFEIADLPSAMQNHIIDVLKWGNRELNKAGINEDKEDLPDLKDKKIKALKIK